MKPLIPAVIVSTLLIATVAVAQTSHVDRALQLHDTNKDSFLAKDEVANSRLARRFDELDIDRDGKLSAPELQAARPDRQGRGQHPRHGEFITQADANKDGLLSKSEATQFMNNRFDQADTNKDGNLSKEELQSGHGKFGFGGDRDRR